MGVIGKLRRPFRHQVRQIAPGIVLEMPFFGHDVAEHPFRLRLVPRQLPQQAAHVPFHDHAADIEHDSLDW